MVHGLSHRTILKESKLSQVHFGLKKIAHPEFRTQDLQIYDQSVKEVLLKHFTIGDDATLIGIAQYSDSPQLEFGLHDHKTTDSLIRAVGNMKYKGGNTATGRALTFALEQVFNRRARPNAQKVVLVITDGESLQDSVTEPARRLRENGVEVNMLEL